jgi:predicted HD superfamily hydrolase involved in NAD metabolism
VERRLARNKPQQNGAKESERARNKNRMMTNTNPASGYISWIAERVSEKRFRHIKGVAEMARRLAPYMPGCSADSAELAGWLHDACKELKDKELLELANEFELSLDQVDLKNPHLLHGPVAACVCRRELGLNDQSILDAMAEHTLGNAPMSPLSQVVFLADMLEEGRPAEWTRPVWKAFDLEGARNFAAAIVATCDVTLHELVEARRTIHPRMILTRNYYLAVS